ncbi:MAG: hypothetical protein ABIK96_06125 [bacterium]
MNHEIETHDGGNEYFEGRVVVEVMSPAFEFEGLVFQARFQLYKVKGPEAPWYAVLTLPSDHYGQKAMRHEVHVLKSSSKSEMVSKIAAVSLVQHIRMPPMGGHACLMSAYDKAFEEIKKALGNGKDSFMKAIVDSED